MPANTIILQVNVDDLKMLLYAATYILDAPSDWDDKSLDALQKANDTIGLSLYSKIRRMTHARKV